MTAERRPAVYLIDASPYIFRAFFSLPSSLVTPGGEPINAVHGWTAFLIKLIGDEQPHGLVAAFDGSLNTSFRNDLYPAYKAQRELPPPDLEAQLDRCRQVAEAMGIPSFVDDRFEADDILGSLVPQVLAAGLRAVVVSSDKDLAQLVGPQIELFDFARDQRYGPEGVREKFGVPPERVPDFLGLAGDSVDNIPGVPGIGAKTAAALLELFDGLPDALDRLDDVAASPLRGARSLAAKLAEHREQALLSLRLATVVADAPFALDPATIPYRGARRQEVESLFAELGFTTLQKRIPRWANE